MNICVVSTFDGNTDDYMEMFNATKEKTKDFMADYHLGIIAWDEKFNCVDEVYSLEIMN